MKRVYKLDESQDLPVKGGGQSKLHTKLQSRWPLSYNILSHSMLHYLTHILLVYLLPFFRPSHKNGNPLG